MQVRKIKNSIIQFEFACFHYSYLVNHEHSYVEDGTECGKGKYCFGSTCTSGNSKIVSKCPKDIQGNTSVSSICFNRGVRLILFPIHVKINKGVRFVRILKNASVIRDGLGKIVRSW